VFGLRLGVIMVNIFVTADLHFGHKKIMEYESRPFDSIEEMDETLIENWNTVVSERDKVFVLGDVSFYGKQKTYELVGRLKGRKILVIGNHDRRKSVSWWGDVGFDEVSKYSIIYNDFIVMSHKPPAYIPSNTPYFYVYGHVHSSEMYKTITETSCCVSVERWDYKPVYLNIIFDMLVAYKSC
jgi:calcineurin-like phosphoesterase family protein